MKVIYQCSTLIVNVCSHFVFDFFRSNAFSSCSSHLELLPMFFILLPAICILFSYVSYSFLSTFSNNWRTRRFSTFSILPLPIFTTDLKTFLFIMLQHSFSSVNIYRFIFLVCFFNKPLKKLELIQVNNERYGWTKLIELLLFDFPWDATVNKALVLALKITF